MAVLKHRFGIVTGPVYCTKIASKLVRTYTDRHGLKDLVRELLNVDLSKQQQSSDWGAEKISDAQLEYAASDVLYLHDLKRHLDRMLQREGRIELADTCFEFLPTRIELDLHGLGRDRHLRAQLRKWTFSPSPERQISATASSRPSRGRNRLVGVLRFAVPAFGGVVFGGLMLQLFLASLGEDFGFSNVSIDRDNLVVDTPSYASMGADGSSYQVQAESARSALDRTDIIHLTKAS